MLQISRRKPSSHLDRPYIRTGGLSNEAKWSMLKSTIENAKITRKWQKRNNGVKVVYVIQGWDLPSTKFCAQKMVQLRVENYGIGSLCHSSLKEIIARIRIVRKIIGREPQLHLFGVSNLQLIKSLSEFIDSFDSSTPAKAGLAKELICPNSGRRRNIGEKQWINCSCPACTRIPYGILSYGVEDTRRSHNRLRMIHNAFWLTKLTRQTIQT